MSHPPTLVLWPWNPCHVGSAWELYLKICTLAEDSGAHSHIFPGWAVQIPSPKCLSPWGSATPASPLINVSLSFLNVLLQDHEGAGDSEYREQGWTCISSLVIIPRADFRKFGNLKITYFPHCELTSSTNWKKGAKIEGSKLISSTKVL